MQRQVSSPSVFRCALKADDRDAYIRLAACLRATGQVAEAMATERKITALGPPQ